MLNSSHSWYSYLEVSEIEVWCICVQNLKGVTYSTKIASLYQRYHILISHAFDQMENISLLFGHSNVAQSHNLNCIWYNIRFLIGWHILRCFYLLNMTCEVMQYWSANETYYSVSLQIDLFSHEKIMPWTVDLKQLTWKIPKWQWIAPGTLSKLREQL